MAAVPKDSIDVLTAFEVLEHVIDEDLTAFIADARRVLKSSGTLIVSVPIMFGPVVLAKEVSR